MYLIECGPGYTTLDGTRSYAALRGDTRRRLDLVLTSELSGTGIGRSAFIQAAIDRFYVWAESDPAELEAFLDAAYAHEDALPR